MKTLHRFHFLPILFAGALSNCVAETSEGLDGDENILDDADADQIVEVPTNIEENDVDGVTALAANRDLFNWSINITGTLRGRDMKSSDGRFCQRYRSDSPTNPNAPPFYVDIQLRRNRTGLPDVGYSTARFRNDGNLHRYCWDFHDPNATYHFQYTVGAIGYRLRGHGTAYH